MTNNETHTLTPSLLPVCQNSQMKEDREERKTTKHREKGGDKRDGNL